MYLLIAYDIKSNKKRNKVATLLESYGYRVNYSVFELNITKQQLKKITTEIEKIIDKQDSVRVYSFNADTVAKSYDLNPKRPNPFDAGANYVN